jgi:hypothetical protein
MQTTERNFARRQTTATATAFNRFAGICAVLGGIVSLGYAISFVIITRLSSSLGNTLSALSLLLGGLLALVTLVALYSTVKQAMPEYALVAVMFSLAGAFGATIHGGYDLANNINPPTTSTDLPSAIDPRGLLTFGLASLGLFLFAGIIGRNRAFPKFLVYLSYLLAALLLVVYLGRLIILDANNPAIVVPAALAGFIINPLWYITVGIALLRNK